MINFLDKIRYRHRVDLKEKKTIETFYIPNDGMTTTTLCLDIDVEINGKRTGTLQKEIHIVPDGHDLKIIVHPTT